MMRKPFHRSRVGDSERCGYLILTSASWQLAATVLAFAALIGGCSDREKSSPSVSAESHPIAVEPSGPARTADEAVRRVLNGLRDRKARAVWDFLPPSYRGEVQQLVRDVAARLDDRTWQPTVAVWQKARKVLPSRGAALFSQPATDAGNARTPISTDSLKRLLDSVGESELASLERLRTIDVGQFWEVTGSDVLWALGQLQSSGSPRDPFANLAKVEVLLVSESGDQATVRMQWPEQAATEHHYIRIEGHWLPKSLADGWSSGLSDVRTQMITWSDRLRDDPETWEANLKNVEQLLAELEATDSDQDAREVWQRGLLRLMSTWSGVTRSAQEELQNDNTTRKPKVSDTEELLPDKP